MGNDTSVLADLPRAASLPQRPAAGRIQLLAILADPAVIRIALLAVGLPVLLLAVAAVL